MNKQYANRAFYAVIVITVAMLCTAGTTFARDGKSASGVETIVLVRHGEKPEKGLGQLNCQGLNRALALPKVLEAKFGKPVAIFAPDPAKTKDDDGTQYDYVRPLATIEPAAIRFGMPVNTAYGFDEIDQLKSALEGPDYRDALIFVAWEHRLIDVLAKRLMESHGGKADVIPRWESADYDSIYVLKINWALTDAPPISKSSISFEHGHEGLDGLPAGCP